MSTAFRILRNIVLVLIGAAIVVAVSLNFFGATSSQAGQAAGAFMVPFVLSAFYKLWNDAWQPLSTRKSKPRRE